MKKRQRTPRHGLGRIAPRPAPDSTVCGGCGHAPCRCDPSPAPPDPPASGGTPRPDQPVEEPT